MVRPDLRRQEECDPLRLQHGLRLVLQQHRVQCRGVLIAEPDFDEQSFSRRPSAEPRGRANLSALLPVTARKLTPRDAQNILMSGDLVNPYYMRWSFGIQRELPGSVILDTAYVGSQWRETLRSAGSESCGPAALARSSEWIHIHWRSCRRQSAQARTRILSIRGWTRCRAFGSFEPTMGTLPITRWQTQVQKRFTSSFGLNAAYTWSKLLDNGSELFTYNNTLPTCQFAAGFWRAATGERAYRCTTARTSCRWRGCMNCHSCASAGALGKIAGGWQIAGITIFESGVPYSVANGADSDGIGGPNRADLNPAGQAGVRAQWVGISATNPYGYVNPDVFDAATGRYISVPIDPKDARYIGLPAFGTAGPPICAAYRQRRQKHRACPWVE